MTDDTDREKLARPVRNFLREQRYAAPGHVEYADLSDDVQQMIGDLRLKVRRLEFESSVYRIALIVSVMLLAWRLWERFF